MKLYYYLTSKTLKKIDYDLNIKIKTTKISKEKDERKSYDVEVNKNFSGQKNNMSHNFLEICL